SCNNPGSCDCHAADTVKAKASSILCYRCGKERAVVAESTSARACAGCFKEAFLHKFKTVMRRKCSVSHGDTVLVALSCSESSAALLHLLHQCVDSNAA